MREKAAFRPGKPALLALLLLSSGHAFAAANPEDLQKKIQALEAELAQTKQALKEAQTAKPAAASTAAAAAEKPNTDMAFDVAGGTLKVGGAVRVNYTAGTYAKDTGGGESSRSFSDGGNVGLDTARINLDYTNGNILGKFEYRFYDGYGGFGTGYHMLHTAWLGYNYDNGSQVQVGVNRVPFGPGPYGISQSFFFDQHYYVGLSDDMDLGVKYTWKSGDWTWDAGYYLQDEGSYKGGSKKADRYSYDVITNAQGNGYEEDGQINLRGIYSTQLAGIDSDVGFSAQFGQLEGKGLNAAGRPTQDGDMSAYSLHMINKWNNFTLASQGTYYDYKVDQAGVGNRGEILMGAFAFPTAVAAEAFIPAVSLSYYYETPSIGWLNYVIPFVEYSSILKEEAGFNDSELYTIGAAFGTAGGWYTYAEYATSNGNDFIGGDGGFNSRFGANPTQKRNHRFNINFGYYF